MDQLARPRPGPVLFHDLDEDFRLAAFGETLQFLYDRRSTRRSFSDAICLYYHPDWDTPLSRSFVDLSDLTLARSVRGKTSFSSDSSAWTVALQRSLEQSAARIYRYRDNHSLLAYQEGAAHALSFVADVINHSERRPAQKGMRITLPRRELIRVINALPSLIRFALEFIQRFLR